MNEAIKNLLERRSIRAYKQEQIKEEELQLILKAGRFAPSGMNRQPWHFTVVQNMDLLSRINDFLREGLLKADVPNQAMKDRARDENFSVFYNAPSLIVVSGDNSVFTSQQDCVLAMGNMFNAAASLGIGSCWIHALIVALSSESGKGLAKELGIPEGYTVYSAGAFGYNAGEAPQTPPKKDEVVSIIK